MEKFDIEKIKKCAGTCCCLDFNGAIGTNLTEKLQIVYVTLVRMQHITRKISKTLPNIVIVQPLVKAMFNITGAITEKELPVIDGYESAGLLYNTWQLYVEEEAWMEHHILMTSLIDGKISMDSKYWCKISLLNCVMSNNFGYFNMDC